MQVAIPDQRTTGEHGSGCNRLVARVRHHIEHTAGIDVHGRQRRVLQLARTSQVQGCED